MATHSRTLAWRTAWTEEAGGLQSMGLQRVGYGLVTNTFTFNNEITEREIKKTIPFTMTTKIKIPKNKFKLGD